MSAKSSASTASSDTDASSSGASDGSASSTGGSTGGTTGGDGSLQQACVDAINGYRATLDLPPYARWTDAEACSDDEAESDAATNTPHGAFGSCNEYAQNECPGWPGDDPEGSLLGCLAQMWAEGPGEDFQTHGHYINMSSTKYTQVACGFYTTGSGDLWAIQNFR